MLTRRIPWDKMFCFLDLFSVVNLLAFHRIKQMVSGEETVHFLLQVRQAGAANEQHHKPLT